MKKRTKIISMAIALVLVTGVMAIGIWAATQASAGINANVSWTASAGVELELEAQVVNNANGTGIGATNTPLKLQKQIINASTSNQDAALIGVLDAGFYDGTNDGVNNPSPIIYTYSIKNTGTNPLNIKVTKSPTVGEETGTTELDHKPKVAIRSTVNDYATSTQVNANLINSNGISIETNSTVKFIITLSMSPSSSALADADLGIANLDAGVSFAFSVGSAGTPSLYINGSKSTTPVNGALTLGDYEDALDDKTYPGYFYDADLTQDVTRGDLLTLATTSTTLYTKSATLDKLDFVSNGDGTCSVRNAVVYDTSISGMLVIPCKSPAGDTVIEPWSGYEAEYFESNPRSSFEGCTNITSIIFPSTMLYLRSQIESGNAMFAGCTSLTNITLQDGLTTIGNCSLGTTALISLYIPASVTSITDLALYGYTSSEKETLKNLTSLVVSDGNTVYNDGNGSNVIIETATGRLMYVAGDSNNIPNGVKIIGGSVFSNTSITSVTIPSSVVTIEYSAFSNCSSLESVIIGNSVTSIGSFAFYDCTNLTSIVIPDSIQVIERNAFEYCTSLTKVYIPRTVETVGATEYYYSSYSYSPFCNCSSTLKIYCGASEKPSGWNDYWNYYASGKTLSVTWGVTRDVYNSTYA